MSYLIFKLERIARERRTVDFQANQRRYSPTKAREKETYLGRTDAGSASIVQKIIGP
jgi:hypothetical protein